MNRIENHHVTRRMADSIFYFDRGYIIEIDKDFSYYQISRCICGGSLGVNTKEHAISEAIHRVDELIRQEADVEKDIERDIEKELQKLKQDLATTIQAVAYKYCIGE